jgi:GNAT superfamily N-acetyltransferase
MGVGVEARRRYQRIRRDSVTALRSGLRGVDSEEAVRSAIALAREYGAWAVELAKREYGIDAQAESEKGLSTSIEELLVPRGRLYLVELERLPVGLGGLKPISDEIAEIKRMYVQPSARGHGLGRQLLEQLLADAHTLDFRLIRLESAAFMTEAHALYRSAGFTDIPPYEGREFADIPGAAEVQVFMALHLQEHKGPTRVRS